jgi:hypothetical protein
MISSMHSHQPQLPRARIPRQHLLHAVRHPPPAAHAAAAVHERGARAESEAHGRVVVVAVGGRAFASSIS